MRAQLLPVNGGSPVTLDRPVTVVGRSARLCDLPLQNNSVSKIHCILVKTDGLLYMRDLGSTNGTRVNGQRVLRGALLPGDQISFSGSAFQVYLGPDSDSVDDESRDNTPENDAANPAIDCTDNMSTSSDVMLLPDDDLFS
ncbi:MAG: FHA domain-containing protein [Fuerstiella sp.]|nr:FHA domain-containing protein [Fuerstiella sp.]